MMMTVFVFTHAFFSFFPVRRPFIRDARSDFGHIVSARRSRPQDSDDTPGKNPVGR
jgi:hypothetical protein